MKKFLLTTLLTLTICSSVQAKEASLSNQDVYLDGKKVEVSGYNIDGSNYFKLRDIAAVLKDTSVGFNVDYNDDVKNIIISRYSKYSPLSTDLMKINDNDLSIQESFSQARVDNQKVKYSGYLINGSNYFKLRDLGKTLGFLVDYNEEQRQVLIKSEKIEPKDLIGTENVNLISLTAVLNNNTSDYSGSLSDLDIYDFTNDITIIGRADDSSQHALDIMYVPNDNILLLSPIQIKFKGNLRLTPVLKIEQGEKSETVVLKSKNIELDNLTSGIDKNADLVLTLGYYEGGNNFKGLSVLNVKGGLK